ncbi:hypothetical protein OG206_31980 [Streptomyces sp. NBC_01341]|uniref:hypothetical protein n=1 Tax=Streptomyces sp. NBC_01341 TaxID=2903831 RepID=UPI002E0FC4A5|nr:hypothetical protein OG206_31980 [Streptomyces sp. NBC_01341]
MREKRDDTGVLLGYAVALPGDRADRGTRPVWFFGSKLAYDLFLPRIRERFDLPAGPVDWTTAEALIREAATLPGAAGRAPGAGDVAALGDLLAVAAAYSPALVRDRLTAAAAAFRAGRPHPGARTLEGRARADWRASARALQQASRRWHEATEHPRRHARPPTPQFCCGKRPPLPASPPAPHPARRPGPRPGRRRSRRRTGRPWPGARPVHYPDAPAYWPTGPDRPAPPPTH